MGLHDYNWGEKFPCHPDEWIHTNYSFVDLLQICSFVHVCTCNIINSYVLSALSFLQKVITPDKREYPRNIFSYFTTKVYVVGTH